MKSFFKKIEIFNALNVALKSYHQEYRVRKSLAYYRKQASKTSNLHDINDIATVLKKRLHDRGINPTQKKKGDLHIFIAFNLTNWEWVLPLSLKPFGKVSVFEWRSLGFESKSPSWIKIRDKMNTEMLRAFKKAHAEKPVDAMIGYLSRYNTNPDILRKIAAEETVIFNFCWDDKLSFRGKLKGGYPTGPALLASVVDLNLTNAPSSLIKYEIEGGLAMFWPEAAHPEIHKPYNVPFEYDVSFVGSKYGWRPRFIAKLQKLGIKVDCFGSGWEKGTVSDVEMVKIYSKSKVNLGFSNVGYCKNLTCLKGRDFEIPMSGGLYLTTNNPELKLVYNVGKEIVTFEDEKDCANKIKWILNNPDIAERIRLAGRKRALSEHTWEKRFKIIFEIAGILEKNDIY